jgi:hypothetical protein
VKLKLLIELDYDADLTHGDDPEAIHWFHTLLLRDRELILHSNEIGDAIGTVRVLQEL